MISAKVGFGELYGFDEAQDFAGNWPVRLTLPGRFSGWSRQAISLRNLLNIQRNRGLKARLSSDPRYAGYFRKVPQLYRIVAPVYRADIGRRVPATIDVGMTGVGVGKRIADKWRGRDISKSLRSVLRRLKVDPGQVRVSIGSVDGVKRSNLTPDLVHEYELELRRRGMNTNWHKQMGLYDPRIRTFEEFEEVTREEFDYEGY